MNAPHLQEDLISLLSGEVDVATLAARHAVTEAEVLGWRAAFVAGMRTSVKSGVARRRRFRWVAVAAMVVGTAAFAQLTVFSANQPALASEVNGNFNQLKAWLEAKVGPVTNSNITTSGAVTSARVSTSYFAPPYAPWDTTTFTGGAGIVNDNATYKALMIAGNTSNGGARKVNLYDDVLVSNDLTVGNNAWGAHTNSGYVSFGNATTNGGTTALCANGQYMCGVQMGHVTGDGNYWTGAQIAIHCCSL